MSSGRAEATWRAGAGRLLFVAWLLLAAGNAARGQTVYDFSPQYLDSVVKAQQIGQQIETNQPLNPSLISHDLTTIATPAGK